MKSYQTSLNYPKRYNYWLILARFILINLNLKKKRKCHLIVQTKPNHELAHLSSVLSWLMISWTIVHNWIGHLYLMGWTIVWTNDFMPILNQSEISSNCPYYISSSIPQSKRRNTSSWIGSLPIWVVCPHNAISPSRGEYINHFGCNFWIRYKSKIY